MSTEDERLRIRLAEILSSAGLKSNQIALEILYLLPTEFIQWYVVLWEKALGSAGSADKSGQQLSRDAGLSKAQTQTRHKGNMVGAGAGGQAKKFKRMGFVIKDEQALALKDRIDRRLRSIAREIRQFDAGSRLNEGRVIRKCGACGKIMDDSWVYCPFDGRDLQSS